MKKNEHNGFDRESKLVVKSSFIAGPEGHKTTDFFAEK